MSKINARLVESLEAIAYQNNDWVIPAMNTIWEKYQNGKVDFKLMAKEWNALIKKRFGFNANLIEYKDERNPDEEVVNAYCSSPRLADATTLYGGLFQEYSGYQKFMTDHRRDIMQRIARGDLTPTGLLDHKKVKASGLFSKIKIEFGLGLGILKKEPPAIVTAIMLHELGHAWTFFEYMGVTAFRNAIIANSVKEVLECQSQEDKYTILIAGINAWGLEIDADKTSKLSNEDITTVIVGEYQRKFTHDVGYVHYDNNTVEILADQFAARFGVGKLLSEFHAKTPEFYREVSKKINKAVNKCILKSVVAAVCSVGAFAAISIFPPSVHGVAFIAGIISAMTARWQVSNIEEKMDMAMSVKLGGTTYDEDKRRIERIYNETVGFLKDPNIPLVLVKQILEELQVIRSYAEKTKTFDPYILRVAEWLNSEYRSQKAKMVYQQMVEDMLANQLYVTAGKLKTLG